MSEQRPSSPPVGFSAHPEALADLLDAPADVRDLALEYLDRLLRAEVRGPLLDQQGDRDLRGARKLYLDERNAYRLVYTEQRAPGNPRRLLGIHLVAVGRRYNIEVYKTAAERLKQVAAQEVPRPGMPARFQAALASSVSRPSPARAIATTPGAVPPTVVAAPPAAVRR
ncbi:hypothetical protein [Kitasatospora sp. NRRL B-11411]|uniref:hypothetical protein n=1 Tax=Kitasatospora sp. NRRL B-11411 TaxID=1463822 RepID=UPI0012FEEE97|nr:hypothetical protein [Kitasatospora sp. NRRL B-11411]